MDQFMTSSDHAQGHVTRNRNNSKAVLNKFKHAFWLVMKNEKMRRENVLL